MYNIVYIAQYKRTKPLLEKLTQELRRGGIVFAVLGALRTEHYGYSLRKALEEQGLAVEEGTLYPLVRRLEQQGLLTSEWREEGRRKKRFYRLSSDGESVLNGLRAHWRALSDSIERITTEE